MNKENNKKKNINLKFNILAVTCIIIFVIGIVEKTLQNDTYYTITLGKYILNNGIDMLEHFSWHEGLIYTYPHWLYDIFIYLIYNVFGFFGIYVSSIVLGIILGISIYCLLSKISKNNLISFFITLLLMFLGRHYITARAQLVTFILFVWEIYFIERFLDTKKKRYAIGLILIPIVIANVHAAVFPFYFILYLPYIGEYIIALLINNSNILTKLFMAIDKKKIDKLSKKNKLSEKEKLELEELIKRVEKNEERLQNKKVKLQEKANNSDIYRKIIVNKKDNVKWLILIMIICAFTGLLTPIGDTPYTYLIHTMQGNTTNNISEHLPLVLAQSTSAAIMISLYLLVLIFTKTKVRLSDLFLYVGLLVLAFMSRRQLSMVLFIGGLAFNNLISDFVVLYTFENEINEVKQAIVSWKGQCIAYLLIVMITVFMLCDNMNDKIVNDASYPVEACDYILENLDINNIRLFNDYNYGSYLMYRGIPVFIDSRADVYDPQFNGLEDDIFQDYIQTNGLSKYYENVFEHYGITHIISYSNSKLSLFLSYDENYNEIYKDDNFVIYERLTN